MATADAPGRHPPGSRFQAVRLDIQRSRNVADLMITHDVSIARAFADRVAVMMKGELVEVGPAEAVLSSPSHEYTRRLVAAVPALG